MNGGKTYLKQYNENTAIRACTNVIKTCHGHVLNVCFSATLWTFHFESDEPGLYNSMISFHSHATSHCCASVLRNQIILLTVVNKSK